MPIEECKYIWKNNEFLPWREATTHVLTHALHYGTSVFEGIRVYKTPSGPQGFRVQDHLKRLFDSAKIYKINLPYDREALTRAIHELLIKNNLEDSYVRPIAYYGYDDIGIFPGPEAPVDVVIAAFPWGRYLGKDAIELGVDACVSSWNRAAPNTIPAAAKAGGNYLSSLLISQEAKSRGYTEGIALDTNGYLSEGAGENIFLVKDGIIYTPGVAASILSGITRDTVIKLAQGLNYTVLEQVLPREMLYLADEVFMTGTAAEITPVRSVDDIKVGTGVRGPVTEAIQDAFFGLFNGKTEDIWGWLEKISLKQSNAA